MKVVISGSYRHSFDRAFEKLVGQVHLFNDEALHNRMPAALRNRYVFRIFWRQIARTIQKDFINTVESVRPDLVLILKGWFYSPQMIAYLKRRFTKTAIFCFNPDNPFNTWHFGSNNVWITQSLRLYDVYFIWGRFLIDELKARGLARVEYLPFAYDPQLDYPTSVSDEERSQLGSDLVFIGNWDSEREHWLRELVDFNLGIWGNDYWLTRCSDKLLRRCYRGNAEHGEFFSKVTAASKISLNILRLQNKTSHNMRTFETPACGGFMLSERSDEAKAFFAEDKEAVYFSTPGELRSKVNYYLEHEEERKNIAQAGYNRCLCDNYTYLERVRSILDAYGRLSQLPKEKKFRIAFTITHPIPCRVPIYKKLSSNPKLDFKIYFLSDPGIREVYDRQFCHFFKWDTLDISQVNYEILSPGKKGNNFMKTFCGGMRIMSDISKNKYDAVVIPGYGMPFYWLVFLGVFLSRTPKVLLGEPRFPEINVPGFKKIFKKPLLRYLFKKVEAFGYIGTQAKKFFLDYGVENSKLFFTPYAANNDYFFAKSEELSPRKQELRSRFGIPEGLPVILYLSKINKNKGAYELLRVFENISTAAALVYVGSGPLLKDLESYVRARRLANVFFFGFQNISQVSNFYALADIFVLFSRAESWGLVVNEAMCFGLPVITTDAVMASYDLVREAENGYVLGAGDTEALARCLCGLLADPQLRRRMGERSLEIIRPWNYDEFVKGLLDAFSSIKQI